MLGNDEGRRKALSHITTFIKQLHQWGIPGYCPALREPLVYNYMYVTGANSSQWVYNLKPEIA